MKQVISTYVHGVTIDVLLEIDTAGLANQLGAKAALAAGRKSKLAHGLIVASVSADDQHRVKALRAVNRVAKTVMG